MIEKLQEREREKGGNKMIGSNRKGGYYDQLGGKRKKKLQK